MVQEAEYWAFIAVCECKGSKPDFCEDEVIFDVCHTCQHLNIEYMEDAIILSQDDA